MKKGQITEGTVDRIVFPNKGIVRNEEGTAIVKNTIPGQRIRFSVNKARKGRFEGRLLEVLEASPLETRKAFCPSFGSCGGCSYQTMDYQSQLDMKRDQVRQLLDGVCKDYEFEGILGSPVEWGYRNKMEFSFGDEVKDGPLMLGLHKKGSFHDIVDASCCKIVHGDYNAVVQGVLDYFREIKCGFYKKIIHEGYLRHLLVRRASKTGEMLISLITTSQQEIDLEPLKKRLLALSLEGRITGILHIINDNSADTVQSDRTEILFGHDFIYEALLGMRFKISTFSFFQTNTLGAEVLYNKVREFAGSIGDKVIFDLYSGTGTIAQVLAPVAKRVVGVEIVEEAVLAARDNAAVNGLHQCTFLVGDVLKIVENIDVKPDLIILDPPRDGIHPKALDKIINFGVNNIIYVSCKPTSLIRDLTVLLDQGYAVKRVACVDMFPETVHIECVVKLCRVEK